MVPYTKMKDCGMIINHGTWNITRRYMYENVKELKERKFLYF